MDFTDLPLFSQPPQDPAESGKQDGMNRANKHADAAWKEAAVQVIRQAALARPFITVNDLWDGLEATGLTTHENRASGPVLTMCAKRGWIAKTGEIIKSTRATRNRGDVAKWRSLIFAPVVVPPTQPEPEYDPEELF